MEFLPDELVEYDVEDFLPDELVLDDVTDDVTTDSSVGFAGPSDAPPPHPALQPKSTASSRPRARATRHAKKSARLGWVATGLAATFGLVAISRLGSIAATHPEAPQPAAMAARPDPLAAPPLATSLPQESLERPVSPSLASATESTGTSSSFSSSSAVSSPSAASGEATDAADAPDVTDAVDLKQRTQQALEKGKLTVALDLGQQAVDADPTDAESWLILGATYLQRGKYKDARQCFSRCVDQATQGPVSECKALLR